MVLLRRLCQEFGWTSLAAIVLAGTMAWAQSPTVMLDIKARPQARQVVLNFATPKQARLQSTVQKGVRRIIIDVPGAMLPQHLDKYRVAKSIESQLPGVAKVTVDDFLGSDPLVRVMIKTQDPQTQGVLLSSQGEQIVLQLVQPGEASATETPAPKDTSQTSTIVEPPARKPQASASTKLAGKTKVDVASASALKRKINEADSLRKERNTLADNMKTVQRLVDQQNAMIAHIKEEQEKLVTKPANTAEKQQIAMLQQQLTELEKSYQQLQRMLESYRGEVALLENKLRLTQDHATGMAEALDESRRIKMPNPGEARGGLLNTLASLSQAEVNKLLEAEKLFREGKKLEFQKNPQQAAAKYRQALAQAPQVQEYALALGALLINQKQYQEAQAVLEAALQYHPEDPDLYNELGKAALMQKDEATALKYFRKALPTGVLSNYASTLRRANKLAESEAMFMLAITANPSDSDLHYNLGNLYLSQKRFAEAQQQFTHALRLNPSFAEAHFHLGLTYAEQGKIQQALDAFNKYLGLMPNAPNKQAVLSYMQDLQQASSRK